MTTGVSLWWQCNRCGAKRDADRWCSRTLEERGWTRRNNNKWCLSRIGFKGKLTNILHRLIRWGGLLWLKRPWRVMWVMERYFCSRTLNSWSWICPFVLGQMTLTILDIVSLFKCLPASIKLINMFNFHITNSIFKRVMQATFGASSPHFLREHLGSS